MHSLKFKRLMTIALASSLVVTVSECYAQSQSKDPSSLILSILQAQSKSDDAGVLSGILKLEHLPKPSVGNGTSADTFNKAGLVFLKQKDYKNAAAQFSKAVSLDASDPKYLSNLGFAELNSGAFDAAINHLYSSIAINTSRQVAWGDLGLAFAKKGDQDKAVASFLIGFKVSNGDTYKFIESLVGDADPAVQKAGQAALARLNYESPKTTGASSSNISIVPAASIASSRSNTGSAPLAMSSVPTKPMNAENTNDNPEIFTGYRLGMTAQQFKAQMAKEGHLNDLVPGVKGGGPTYRFKKMVFEFSSVNKLVFVRVPARTEDDFTDLVANCRKQHGDSIFNCFKGAGGYPFWQLDQGGGQHHLFLVLEKNLFWSGANSDFGWAVYTSNSPLMY